MKFNKQKYYTNKKQSNLSEFISFLFDQKFNYQFRSLVYMPLNFKKIEEKVKLYNFFDDNLLFTIEYENKPVLIYNINEIDNTVNDVYCLDKNLYKDLLLYFSNNIVLSDIPMIERIE